VLHSGDGGESRGAIAFFAETLSDAGVDEVSADICRQRRETHCKRGIKLTLGSDVFVTCKSPTRTVAKVVQFPVEPNRRAAIAQLSAK